MISDAAELMLRCAGYLADRQAEKKGWKVFYAVDVDVVKLYLSPVDRTDYATVFGQAEDAGTRELLARLVGEFIFRGSRCAGDTDFEKRTLFIVPPHNGELESMIFGLSAMVIKDADDVERKLDVVLAELCNRRKANEPLAVAQWLIDAAPKLVEVFDGKSGPQAELARFEALEESRLLNLERYREASTNWVFPLLRMEDNENEFETFTNAFSAWKDRLLKYKAHSQKKKSLVRDAYVLATIELLNERMSTEHRKLVLVTGTSGIQGAARDYLVRQDGEGADSFADLYIRHPQSFMADPAFFGNSSGSEQSLQLDGKFNLVEWLNLFFPRVVQEGVARTRTAMVDRALLRKIRGGVERGFHDAVNFLATSDPRGELQRHFPESMLDEWKTQVRTTSVSREIDSGEFSHGQRALALIDWLQFRIDRGFTLGQLRDDLANHAVRSLSSLYSSTALLGIWSHIDPRPERIRGIPALRFDKEYELAQDYCKRVVDAMRASGRNEGEGSAAKVNLAEMYSQLSIIDAIHYHSHVIHALAYATKGHWAATRTLCRLALSAVDGLSEGDKRNRKGREAAYLLVIAERRLALTVKDLDEAKRYLREAESREDAAARKDSRFLSEAIAIEVAEVNFKYFLGGDSSSVLSVLEAVIPTAVELFVHIDEDPLKPARGWVTQQVLTNVLDLALVAHAANLPLPLTVLNHVRSFVLAALSHMDAAESNWNAVAEFICLIASIVFETNFADKLAHLEKLNKLQFPVYMPFDKVREERFRQMATSACC